ncbi:MAG: tRNA lysidine(34) synthetase TilS [Proteobacteria bacterium]|nr:tRNA lysidine(34) synthetase TilS [Pseudomonadota bacterium]NBX85630.1 tRNA lysidine(34) synthetase TilS [Pseudomonadota bacterium]
MLSITLQTPWLIAVSGGGDSIALLHMLLQQGNKNHLTVACFNHNWSTWGTQATHFVQTFCQQHNLPFVTATGQGRGAHNAEELARTERLNWFAEICQTHKLKGVILAHTQTDNVETFLMRAGKGSGLQGLSAMAEHTHLSTTHGPLHIWRPLLHLSRQHLRDYLAEHNQPYLEDPSNTEATSQRAKIRQLLPQLEKVGIPAHAVAASIASLQRANAALHNTLQTLIPNIQKTTPTTLQIPLPWLLSQPTEYQLLLLAHCQQQLAPQTQIPRTTKRQQLLTRLAENPKGKSTLGPLQFTWNSTRLTVSHNS